MGEHSVNTPSHRISKLSALRRDTIRKIDQVGLAETLTHGVKKIARDLRCEMCCWSSCTRWLGGALARSRSHACYD
jgi:hypothetical protein